MEKTVLNVFKSSRERGHYPVRAALANVNTVS